MPPKFENCSYRSDLKHFAVGSGMPHQSQGVLRGGRTSKKISSFEYPITYIEYPNNFTDVSERIIIHFLCRHSQINYKLLTISRY